MSDKRIITSPRIDLVWRHKMRPDNASHDWSRPSWIWAKGDNCVACDRCTPLTYLTWFVGASSSRKIIICQRQLNRRLVLFQNAATSLRNYRPTCTIRDCTKWMQKYIWRKLQIATGSASHNESLFFKNPYVHCIQINFSYIMISRCNMAPVNWSSDRLSWNSLITFS